jgi:hypothetical protein
MSFQEIWEEIGPIVKRVVVWAAVIATITGLITAGVLTGAFQTIIDHMLSYLPAKT